MSNNTNANQVLPGAARRITLSQDFATLVNNPQGSDIEFKVGGGENDKVIKHKSATVTIYAHSVILCRRSRYFAALLDKENHWKKSAKSLIYKPNISPKTFQDIIRYIYTGSIRVRNSANVFELITIADEMELEELSIACQTELMRTVKYIFLGEDENDDESEIGEASEDSTKKCIPIGMAIRTHIIPALNSASKPPLSSLSEKVLTITLLHISVITNSVYTQFVNGISSEVLAKIVESDNLVLTELSVWDLVLSWACNQLNITKTAVEARFKKIGDAGGDSSVTATATIDTEKDIQKKPDDSIISMAQLKQLKTVLVPFLPAVRISLFENKDYAHMMHILNYLLPNRRSLEIKNFFIDPDYAEELDSPRIGVTYFPSPSLIIVEPASWKLLRENILKTGGITGCTFLKHLKFKLLFRASEHGFSAGTFHQLCNNKGPTLTVVKSMNGYLFGGVNFTDWSSDGSYSNCSQNFLFALPDGKYRKDSAIFRIETQENSQYSAYNYSVGPSFGKGPDLQISDISNSNQYSYNQYPYNNQYSSNNRYPSNNQYSYAISNLPKTYNGSGASNTALAGAQQFQISNYEVFAISK